MNIILSISAAAALSLLATGTASAEYPTFQLNGLPITPHQVQIVGPAGVTEMRLAPALASTSSPSPHQALVLGPRRPAKQQLAGSARQLLELPRTRPAR